MDVIEEMIHDFAKGHPAESHPRSRSRLREAYFGNAPFAQLVVASRDDRVCARVRAAGGEFLYGGGNVEVERLYERVVIGSPARHCHLSAEAFQAFADLAGLAPRTIVRRLPSTELNRVAAAMRSSIG